jgi:hypothetical protein
MPAWASWLLAAPQMIRALSSWTDSSLIASAERAGA